MSIGSRLSPIKVLDPEGRSIETGSYWKEKPVVFVFIRHFGRLFAASRLRSCGRGKANT